MNNKTTTVLVITCLCIIVIPGLFVWNDLIQKTEITESKLKFDDFQVITGYSRTPPTIVQTVRSYSEFVEVAHSIGTTIVYHIPATYPQPSDVPTYMIVANETYGCVYQP